MPLGKSSGCGLDGGNPFFSEVLFGSLVLDGRDCVGGSSPIIDEGGGGGGGGAGLWVLLPDWLSKLDTVLLLLLLRKDEFLDMGALGASSRGSTYEAGNHPWREGASARP